MEQDGKVTLGSSVYYKAFVWVVILPVDGLSSVTFMFTNIVWLLHIKPCSSTVQPFL